MTTQVSDVFRHPRMSYQRLELPGGKHAIVCNAFLHDQFGLGFSAHWKEARSIAVTRLASKFDAFTSMRLLYACSADSDTADLGVSALFMEHEA